MRLRSKGSALTAVIAVALATVVLARVAGAAPKPSKSAPRDAKPQGVAAAPKPSKTAPRDAKPQDVAASPLWDDGKAEISQYEGTTLRYDQPRATKARIVIVKEDLLRDAQVKSLRGPVPGKTTEVLKIVFVAEFTTGSYFYRQAATTFLDRRSLEVLKESMSHFDGCGITFVRVGTKGGRTVHEAHSYWEGEDDRQVPVIWPAGGSPRVHWDALPLWLREYLPAGVPAQVFLLPSQVSGHSPIEATKPVVAAIRWSDVRSITVPAGRFAARLAEVDTPRGTDRFWFDARFPHVMLKMETEAGRTLALKKTQRLDYWNHHALGDEKQVE